MRKILLAAALSAGALLGAADAAPSPSTNSPAPPAAIRDNGGTVSSNASPAVASDNAKDAAADSGSDTNLLRLNFRGASLDQVLSYFSDAAGFIINVKPGTSVRGRVDVWSSQPLTKEQAVNLLDTVLNENGLAAIRNGNTLNIVSKDEAKTQNIPVMQGADPDQIPVTDRVVTQVIPVRFVEVDQLLKDLQPLVSSVNSTITADTAGNAIIITDTQAVIHKVAEIIKAIDSGAQEFTELRVFRLTNADPNDMADLLSNLFPDESRGQNSSAFGGFRSFFSSRYSSRYGGGFPGSSSSSSSGSNDQRAKKRDRVIAVADTRTASVVVSASHDLMGQIAEMIQELDSNPKGRATVKVYQFQNADPRDVLPVLQDMFNKNMSQSSRNNANSAYETSPLMNRGSVQNNQTSTSTSRGSSSRGSRSMSSFGR